MPTYQRGEATIYYEDQGSGFPLLLLAPGGLNSTVGFWGRMPLNPIEAFANDFRIITMDQRNAGDRSRGPIETKDPWAAYADDQLGLLDHLGIDRALVMGCCIGCSFIFSLVQKAPNRVAAGALLQPIGLDDSNPGAFGIDTWKPWGEELSAKRPDVKMDAVEAFGHAMFDPGFVFTATRDEVRSMTTPMILLYGNDRAHPWGVSVEVASLLSNAELVERWRDPDVVPEVTERLRNFLKKHASAGVA